MISHMLLSHFFVNNCNVKGNYVFLCFSVKNCNVQGKFIFMGFFVNNCNVQLRQLHFRACFKKSCVHSNAVEGYYSIYFYNKNGGKNILFDFCDFIFVMDYF